VTFGDVYATLFRHLGIDAGLATINDLSGRPQYLVEYHARPLAELVSWGSASPTGARFHIGKNLTIASHSPAERHSTAINNSSITIPAGYLPTNSKSRGDAIFGRARLLPSRQCAFDEKNNPTLGRNPTSANRFPMKRFSVVQFTAAAPQERRPPVDAAECNPFRVGAIHGRRARVARTTAHLGGARSDKRPKWRAVAGPATPQTATRGPPARRRSPVRRPGSRRSSSRCRACRGSARERA
jgi:hypothetical protein